MALIIAGSYMVRYPLGGNLSWSLQWLLGLRKLGHQVVFVEKSHYADSCYDPIRKASGDDFSYGLQTTAKLLERFGLTDGWCYVDHGGGYHGMSRTAIEQLFRSADLFLDLGTQGAWLEEASRSGIRVFVDGEPGFTQIRMENGTAAKDNYDCYFSNGANVGTPGNKVPTVGKTWHSVFNPVVTSLFPVVPPPPGARYSTVMNWQSHQPCHYRGQTFGQKDVEFSRFFDLPRQAPAGMELAVSGTKIPTAEIEAAGWHVRDAQEVTISYDAYLDYIRSCRGEFSVCKNIFVAMETGWFSDRSAAYLASGRPVVLQDTGFSRHLPVGEGLFAVRDVDEATAALAEIEADYTYHSQKAREIACEHLDSEIVLRRFLTDIGL